VDADQETEVRWYQVDTNQFPESEPTLVQSGNVDPGPGLWTWMPHIAVDGSDNLGIGFSIVGLILSAVLVRETKQIAARESVDLAESHDDHYLPTQT